MACRMLHAPCPVPHPSLHPPSHPSLRTPKPFHPCTAKHSTRLRPCHADWSKFQDRINLEDRPDRDPAASSPQPYKDSGSGWGKLWDEDWDPKNIPEELKREKAGLPPRRKEGDRVRDKWLSPLLDVQSVRDALNPDEGRAEERIKKEALTNDVESKDAVKFVGVMLGSAFASAFVVSKMLAEPILNFTLTHNPHAFELSDHQKVEAAHHVHIEEFRVKMESTIGKVPPMDQLELYRHLREFAREVEEEERDHNEHALLNVVSDSVTGAVIFGFLAQQSDGRRALFSSWSRVFNGLSDMAKAFIIILVADTFLGYHSAEGWTGFLNLVSEHWGFEPSHAGMNLFVAIVPVTADVMFKYWIFTRLNSISPEAVVTIKAMNRH